MTHQAPRSPRSPGNQNSDGARQYGRKRTAANRKTKPLAYRMGLLAAATELRRMLQEEWCSNSVRPEQVVDIFRRMDAEHDGRVDYWQFVRALRESAPQTLGKLGSKQLHLLFDEANGGDCGVDYQELSQFLHSKRGLQQEVVQRVPSPEFNVSTDFSAVSSAIKSRINHRPYQPAAEPEPTCLSLRRHRQLKKHFLTNTHYLKFTVKPPPSPAPPPTARQAPTPWRDAVVRGHSSSSDAFLTEACQTHQPRAVLRSTLPSGGLLPPVHSNTQPILHGAPEVRQSGAEPMTARGSSSASRMRCSARDVQQLSAQRAKELPASYVNFVWDVLDSNSDSKRFFQYLDTVY